MNNTKLGKEPAFANVAFDKDGMFTHVESEGHFGMTKRFYAACTAMGGMLANSNPSMTYMDKIKFVKDCYEYADELLKQENNE